MPLKFTNLRPFHLKAKIPNCFKIYKSFPLKSNLLQDFKAIMKAFLFDYSLDVNQLNVNIKTDSV